MDGCRGGSAKRDYREPEATASSREAATTSKSRGAATTFNKRYQLLPFRFLLSVFSYFFDVLGSKENTGARDMSLLFLLFVFFCFLSFLSFIFYIHCHCSG